MYVCANNDANIKIFQEFEKKIIVNPRLINYIKEQYMKDSPQRCCLTQYIDQNNHSSMSLIVAEGNMDREDMSNAIKWYFNKELQNIKMEEARAGRNPQRCVPYSDDATLSFQIINDLLANPNKISNGKKQQYLEQYREHLQNEEDKMNKLRIQKEEEQKKRDEEHKIKYENIMNNYI